MCQKQDSCWMLENRESFDCFGIQQKCITSYIRFCTWVGFEHMIIYEHIWKRNVGTLAEICGALSAMGDVPEDLEGG